MPAISLAPNHKAIEQYYHTLADLHSHGAQHEQATRQAFGTLLATLAKSLVEWTLILEQPLANGKIPDGTLRDEYNLAHGYWEAKDTGDDLATEIRKKLALGYPTSNMLFEDTRRAVLYQDGRVAMECDLTKPQALADLLRLFLGYSEPVHEHFLRAVAEFKERIPELAEGLLERIRDEHAQHNSAFRDAWASFFTLCQTSLDPHITSAAVDEMLVQHLLTERLFRTVFDNPDFTRRNVIAAEIERVIDALTSRAFNRGEFLRKLDRFYVAIEQEARSLREWSEKQGFLNVVYERFFQGYSVRQADTHGIVYTPQEIVDFMCASVEVVLQREFGRSLSTEGVRILDPATGTGSFVVNLLRRIAGVSLEQKYRHDLFANEIMLLPYYIASLNIEHEYYVRTGSYLPFEGIAFADTLAMAERITRQGEEHIVAPQFLLMTEKNTERVEREKAAQIMVVIGNPPYNVGQQSENDNNKNRKYPVIDDRVRETYAKDSQAQNRNSLSDPYVKFFRWAVDRLQGHDGIVCYVSNNSFVNQIAFDGMRQHLLQDFTQVYHLDLHGNVRQNPKLSGTTHNVFGIQVGVGITVAVRSARHTERALYYHRVPERWRREQKTRYLAERGSIANIEWQELQPDERHTWLTEGMQPEFVGFMPVAATDIAPRNGLAEAGIFSMYSNGLKSNRDTWVYDFDRMALAGKVRRFIETYNGELDRWKRRGSETTQVDDFVTYDDTRIKWSRDLKLDLVRNHPATFTEAKIRTALYRPFCKQLIFFDRILNEEVYQLPRFFPTPATEAENQVICVAGPGDRKGFGTLATNHIPSLDLAFEKAQCFPMYTYAEDGTERRENITEWALGQFRAAYGAGVSRRDIFHYVYAMLHHPTYRERYAENLKRELPRIPLVAGAAAYAACVRVGEALAALHLGYEAAQPYPLRLVETPGQQPEWRVEKKMRLTDEKTTLIYNDWLRLEGIPPQCYEYRLGNRSALEWVIDQYHVSEDSRSKIVTDPNRHDDPRAIVRLVGQVVAVSVETVRLVGELAASVDLLAEVGVAPVGVAVP